MSCKGPPQNCLTHPLDTSMVKLFPKNGFFNAKSTLGGKGEGKTHFQGEGCEPSEPQVQNGMVEPFFYDQTPINPLPLNTSPKRNSIISQKTQESPKRTPKRKREDREKCENVAKCVKNEKNELSGIHLPPHPSEMPKTGASMLITSKFGPIGTKHFSKPKAKLTAYKAKQAKELEFGSLYCKSNIKNYFSSPLAPIKITCRLPNSHLVQNLKVKKEDKRKLSSSKGIVGLSTQDPQQISDQILEKDSENAG